jgi:hypothetical protein
MCRLNAVQLSKSGRKALMNVQLSLYEGFGECLCRLKNKKEYVMNVSVSHF